MKNTQKGFGSLIVVLVLLSLAIAGAGYTGWRVYEKRTNKQESSQQTAEKIQQEQSVAQSMINPKTKESVEITGSKVYAVVLGDAQYWGYAKKINDSYMALTDVLYQEANSQTVHKLGSELHGPESVMFIQSSEIKEFKEITGDNEVHKTVLEQLQTVEPSTLPASSKNIADYIKTGQYQALNFGEKWFFTKITDLSGDFLNGNSKVYTLRTNTTSGGQNDISLVLVEPKDLAGYNEDKLVYWENMKADSQISQAIDQHKKIYPN